MSADALAQAYAAIEANDLDRAEEACRLALQVMPLAGEPLHLLGIAARRRNRPDEAEALMREAWRRAPDQPDIANNLCALLCDRLRPQDAVDVADAGLSRHPDYPFLHANRGVALHGLRREEDAAAAFQAALAGQPDLEVALFGLAGAFEALGRLPEATNACHALLSRHPGHADGWNLLGRILAVQDRHDEAVAALKQAVAANPAHAQGWINLASSLLKQQRPEEALAAAETAIALAPDSALAFNNAAIICQELVRLDEAITYSRRAVALDPENVDAHWCLSLQLLYAGRWGEGWDEYEWRWRLPYHRMMEGPPVWAGQILGPNALLVNCEQGQGDSLQFLRYLPMLAPYCSNIILRVQTSLQRLAAASFPQATVIGYEDEIPPVPFQVPLMSLPRLFGCRTEADIPADIPYLRPDPLAVTAWRQRWRNEDGGQPLKRIGLAWRGSPSYKRDHLRSLPLEALASLTSRPGCRFYALHPDIREEEREILARLGITDLSASLGDFADTAALLESLDLVISVDTSAVHLAGALGRPAWVMLPFSCDWRWGDGRADSPWYPSVRLFRQGTAQDWPPVLAAIAAALDA